MLLKSAMMITPRSSLYKYFFLLSCFVLLIIIGACSAEYPEERESAPLYSEYSYEAESQEVIGKPEVTQRQSALTPNIPELSATENAQVEVTQMNALKDDQPHPGIPERRQITVEWPPRIRVGDSDVVRFTFELDEDGSINATAEVDGHETRSESVQIPNLYESHDVFIDARLDISGLDVIPDEVERRQLHPGNPVTFYWSISPSGVGEYRGVVHPTLVFVPKKGGLEEHKSLPSQLIEIRAVNLFGMSGQTARLVGGMGTLIGSILGLDNVILWIIGLFRKRKGT